MDQIRPYLFWIILGVIVIALLVVRFGPVGILYGEARMAGKTLDKMKGDLQKEIDKGDKLPRQELTKHVKKNANTLRERLASDEFRRLVMDYETEEWPPMNDDIYVDFGGTPKDLNTFRLKVGNLRRAQAEQANEVWESVKFFDADPAKGEHLIGLPSDLVPASGAGSGVAAGAGLRLILPAQRLLWLRRALYRVITKARLDPETKKPATVVKAVRSLSLDLANPEDIGFPPIESRTGPPYVELTWAMLVDVPLHQVPVLLNDIAASDRHLQVRDVAILAIPKSVVDFRTGDAPVVYRGADFGLGTGGLDKIPGLKTEPRRERRTRPGGERQDLDVVELQRRRNMARFRTGRLVMVYIKGVSYDFLNLPPKKDPTEKRWPT